MGIWNAKPKQWFAPKLPKDSEYLKILDHIKGKDGQKLNWRNYFLKFWQRRRYSSFGVFSINIFLDELEGWQL